MTETEWQELSDLLALEVMELEQVESLYGIGKLWDSKDGHEFRVANTSTAATAYEVWQPHNNVAQAMLLLKTLLIKIGRYVAAVIRIWPEPYKCRVVIHNWVYKDGVPALYVESPLADTEAHAICLVVRRCLETLKRLRSK